MQDLAKNFCYKVLYFGKISLFFIRIIWRKNDFVVVFFTKMHKITRIRADLLNKKLQDTQITMCQSLLQLILNIDL